MKLIKATKGHSYAGKYRKAGAVYKASNSDAKVLIAIRKAVIYVAPPVVEPPKRRGRPRKTETTEEAPKRTYRRRDMQAETE
jgi:hypothetical protein